MIGVPSDGWGRGVRYADMSNRMVERPDRIAVAATVSIPEGMTVAEVNAAADAASAARAAQRDEEER